MGYPRREKAVSFGLLLFTRHHSPQLLTSRSDRLLRSQPTPLHLPRYRGRHGIPAVLLVDITSPPPMRGKEGLL